MKICQVCLSSDILCNGCGKKLEKGLMSETDIAISRAIFKLGLDAEFSKSAGHSNCIIVLADSRNSGLLIGRGGRNAKRLSTMLGKELRVIEQTGNEKTLIEKIVSAPILGINKIYGRTELYKLRIERRFRKRVEGMAPLLAAVLGKEVRMVFE